jgi:hypothetical protein
MRYGRRLALLVAILLVGSTLGAVAAAASHTVDPSNGSLAPASRPGAAGAVSVGTLNSAGVATTTFTAGTLRGTNSVYFSVSDTNVNDSLVNLSVNDPAAARDGYTDPVWTATVGFTPTDRTNDTNATGLRFTIPSTLAQGAAWNVTATAPAGGSANASFQVDTFSLFASTSPSTDSNVLPGEAISLSWLASSTVNGATYPDLDALELDAQYTANGSTQSVFAGGIRTLPTDGVGSVTFAVPDNATGDTGLDWQLWAIDLDASTVTEIESVSEALEVGTLAIQLDQLSATPFCSFTSVGNDFSEGTTLAVCVQAGASYAGSFSPVPGLSVDLAFWNGSSIVAPPGAPPSHLLTNSSGEIGATFAADVPPFVSSNAPTHNYNDVHVGVTNPSDANHTAGSTSVNLTFYIGAAPTAGIVTVATGQPVYFTGDTVVAAWQVGSTSGSGSPYRPFAWLLYALPTDALLAVGNLSGSSIRGNLTVPVPSAYTGEFLVEIEAANATEVASGNASAWMRSPEILLAASASYYLPGGSLTFTVTTAGGAVLEGSTLYFTVWAFFATADGSPIAQTLIENGTTVNGGDIVVAVPGSATPSEYEVDVWAQSPTLGLYASSTMLVDEAAGYSISVGVPTPPKNADGTYAPGQTVLVAYAITTYGALVAPRSYSIDIGIFGSGEPTTVTSESPTGNVSLTIPASQPEGAMEIVATVTGTGLNGANCTPTSCLGYTWIVVNPHPVAATTPSVSYGFTLAWWVLLAIVIVMGLVLYGLLRPPSVAPLLLPEDEDGDLGDPAPAPDGPAPHEWAEPEEEGSEASSDPDAAPPALPRPPTEP